MGIILWIILGAVAGAIADMLMKSNHGMVEDIILGVIGAFVGGFVLNLFGQTGFTGFNLYGLFVAVVGAMVVIFLGRILHR